MRTKDCSALSSCCSRVKPSVESAASSDSGEDFRVLGDRICGRRRLLPGFVAFLPASRNPVGFGVFVLQRFYSLRIGHSGISSIILGLKLGSRLAFKFGQRKPAFRVLNQLLGCGVIAVGRRRIKLVASGVLLSLCSNVGDFPPRSASAALLPAPFWPEKLSQFHTISGRLSAHCSDPAGA